MTVDTKSYRPEVLLKVERAIADEYGLTLADLLERDRDMYRAEARFMVWYIAFARLKYTKSRIGRLYGKDHSSIIHGIVAVQDRGLEKRAEDIVEKVYPGLLSTYPQP